ncbi:keratin, type II cytoskeletal 8 [Oryzias latipes]|uniref:Keratin, type II cytoskeletal 8 n=1 Tax=Oryzias latipes TaxID=8090 RepID=H2L3G2_ORYLA|nr:keratin, type II cytoskeletal 8 [Oryzias latipes]
MGGDGDSCPDKSRRNVQTYLTCSDGPHLFRRTSPVQTDLTCSDGPHLLRQTSPVQMELTRVSESVIMSSSNHFTEIKRDKDGMKEGNDQFLVVISQVIQCETENKKLEEKLKILKRRDVHTWKVDEIVRRAEKELEQQLHAFLKDQEKLKEELSVQMNELEDTRRRYEEEKKKRSEEKNKFITSKKALEHEWLIIADLMVEKRVLNNKLNFLRAGFNEELKELESKVQNEKRVISDTHKRSLDLENIIKSLEAHYAAIADRTKQEVDRLNRKKIDALRQTSSQHEQKAHKIKGEMILLRKSITELQTKLEVQQTKEKELEIDLKQEGGDDAEITGLEEELKKKREILTLQVREHQKLLNIKLGLDMEIATYGGLLENEEKGLKDIHPE